MFIKGQQTVIILCLMYCLQMAQGRPTSAVFGYCASFSPISEREARAGEGLRELPRERNRVGDTPTETSSDVANGGNWLRTTVKKFLWMQPADGTAFAKLGIISVLSRLQHQASRILFEVFDVIVGGRTLKVMQLPQTLLLPRRKPGHNCHARCSLLDLSLLPHTWRQADCTTTCTFQTSFRHKILPMQLSFCSRDHHINLASSYTEPRSNPFTATAS
jgi:hypothetical protein